MKKSAYVKQIKANMQAIGTYKPEFDKVISVLAQLYEDIDTARKQFEESGGQMVIEFTNKRGATNIIKSPYYRLLEDLQADVLQYNRELGLTPKGLKTINDKEMSSKKKESKLDAAMRKILDG